jgi:adenine-specific DNA-methyltransferase
VRSKLSIMSFKEPTLRSALDAGQEPRTFSRRRPSESLTCDSVRDALCLVPTTRFYGSKRRLLDWLLKILWPLEFKTVLDPFGGTASVSLLFRMMGKDVSFHDGLHCNAISARVVLNESSTVTFNLEQHLREIRPTSGFITKTFGGKYFPDHENRWLDGAAAHISGLPRGPHRDTLLHCLFQACLRKRPFNAFHRANLAIRLNPTANRSFGNATTWQTSFSDHMRYACGELKDLHKQTYGGVASVLAPRDLFSLPHGSDLVYVDPPYIRQDRSPERYIRMYHFLEGLALYEQWPKLIVPGSRLASLPDNYYPRDWEHKPSFSDLLSELIRKHRSSIVVLSYVQDAHPTEQTLRRLFRSTFARTSVYRRQIPHALSRRTTTELTIVGRPT